MRRSRSLTQPLSPNGGEGDHGVGLHRSRQKPTSESHQGGGEITPLPVRLCASSGAYARREGWGVGGLLALASPLTLVLFQ